MTTNQPITEAQDVIVTALRNLNCVTQANASVLTIDKDFDKNLALACSQAPGFVICPIFSAYSPVNEAHPETALGFVDFDVNVVSLEEQSELAALNVVQQVYALNRVEYRTDSGQLAIILASSVTTTMSSYPYLIYSMNIRIALP